MDFSRKPHAHFWSFGLASKSRLKSGLSQTCLHILSLRWVYVSCCYSRLNSCVLKGGQGMGVHPLRVTPPPRSRISELCLFPSVWMSEPFTAFMRPVVYFKFPVCRFLHRFESVWWQNPSGRKKRGRRKPRGTEAFLQQVDKAGRWGSSLLNVPSMSNFVVGSAQK